MIATELNFNWPATVAVVALATLLFYIGLHRAVKVSMKGITVDVAEQKSKILKTYDTLNGAPEGAASIRELIVDIHGELPVIRKRIEAVEASYTNTAAVISSLRQDLSRNVKDVDDLKAAEVRDIGSARRATTKPKG